MPGTSRATTALSVVFAIVMACSLPATVHAQQQGTNTADIDWKLGFYIAAPLCLFLFLIVIAMGFYLNKTVSHQKNLEYRLIEEQRTRESQQRTNNPATNGNSGNNNSPVIFGRDPFTNSRRARSMHSAWDDGVSTFDELKDDNEEDGNDALNSDVKTRRLDDLDEADFPHEIDKLMSTFSAPDTNSKKYMSKSETTSLGSAGDENDFDFEVQQVADSIASIQRHTLTATSDADHPSHTVVNVTGESSSSPQFERVDRANTATSPPREAFNTSPQFEHMRTTTKRRKSIAKEIDLDADNDDDIDFDEDGWPTRSETSSVDGDMEGFYHIAQGIKDRHSNSTPSQSDNPSRNQNKVHGIQPGMRRDSVTSTGSGVMFPKSLNSQGDA